MKKKAFFLSFCMALAFLIACGTGESSDVVQISNADCRFYTVNAFSGDNFDRKQRFLEQNKPGEYSYDECIELIEQFKPVVDASTGGYDEEYVKDTCENRFDSFFTDKDGRYYMETFDTGGHFSTFEVTGYDGRFITNQEVKGIATADHEFKMVFYQID